MKKRLQAWGNRGTISIVSCLVFNETGEILLLKRHQEDLGGNKWCTPGGRIDSGESAKAAMQRELWEETALEPKELLWLGVHEVRMPHGNVHMISYRTIVPLVASIQLDPLEHQAYCWFSLHQLLVTQDIIWGLPTVLRDFGYLANFAGKDPTLNDGSKVLLLEQ